MVHQFSTADDEVPQDLKAYFVHPLNSSTDSNGSLALLHEYQSLPALNKTDNHTLESNDYDRKRIDGVSNADLYNCIVDDMINEQKLHVSALLKNNNDDDDGDVLHDQDDLERYVDTNDLINVSTLQFYNSEEVAATDDIENNSILSLPIADISDEIGSPVITQDRINDIDDKLLKSSTKSFEENVTDYELGCQNSSMDHSSLGVKHSKADSDKQQHDVRSEAQPVYTNSTTNPLQSNFINTHSSQPGTTKTTSSQAIPCSMQSTQLMPPEVVHTSSGPMQVTPFIHNGQLGISQVAPCRPHLAQPVYPAMGMNPSINCGWLPAFHSYNMNHMACQEPMRMSSMPVFQLPNEQYMMRPSYPMQANRSPNVIHNSREANITQLSMSRNMPVCQQLKLQQQLRSQQMPSCSPENHVTRDGDLKPSLQAGNNLYIDRKHGADTLQRVCALSNIQSTSQLGIPITNVARVRSPDSGCEDNMLELPSSSESEVTASNPSSPNEVTMVTHNKRRKSLCSLSRQHSANRITQNMTNCTNNTPSYTKRENDDTGFHFYLEAATSCSARIEDDRITYLNKGQWYTLHLEKSPNCNTRLSSSKVKSIIVLRFRESQQLQVSPDDYWKFWCASRQREQKEQQNIKCIDIDLNNQEGIIDNSLCNTGVNSLSFEWDVNTAVNVQIAVNCLSTDFSNQKGVKGLPLHIQIDTYDLTVYQLVHKAYAQIKIFCDKGAERKARDEEKKKEKAKPGDTQNGNKQPLEQYHPVCEHTEFYSMLDLEPEDLAYTYSPPRQDHHRQDVYDDGLYKSPGEHCMANDISPGVYDAETYVLSKKPKMVDPSTTILYVKEKSEEAYTPITLTEGTLESLCQSMKEKFPVLREISMVYKKTKGILIKMDDAMAKRMMHESVYEMEFQPIAGDHYNVTLTEVPL